MGNYDIVIFYKGSRKADYTLIFLVYGKKTIIVKQYRQSLSKKLFFYFAADCNRKLATSGQYTENKRLEW